MVNLNSDEIREKILQALYRIHNSARGRDSELAGIRDLSKEVKKEITDIKERQVASNVSYLVQNGYVKEEAVENFYAKSKWGNSKQSYKYRLSREGLSYFEHGSKFDRGNTFAGIGDVSGNGNYIIMGNQNSITSIANTQYEKGHRLAEDLRHRVNALGEFSDPQKIGIQSDIETIKSQLAKQSPDPVILHKAKQNLSFLADVAAVAPFAIKLFEWIVAQFPL